MPVAEAPQRIEDKTIQPIPPNERHGRTRDLFSLWFGSNIMLLTVVTGALATSVYGLPFWLSVIAIVVGNLLGAVLMALHSAQGPRLGGARLRVVRARHLRRVHRHGDRLRAVADRLRALRLGLLPLHAGRHRRQA